MLQQKIKKRREKTTIVKVQRTKTTNQTQAKPNPSQTQTKPEAKRKKLHLQGTERRRTVHVCVVDDGRLSTADTQHTQHTQLLFTTNRENTHRITPFAPLFYHWEPRQPPPSSTPSRGCRTRDETETRGKKERERGREEEGRGKSDEDSQYRSPALRHVSSGSFFFLRCQALTNDDIGRIGDLEVIHQDLNVHIRLDGLDGVVRLHRGTPTTVHALFDLRFVTHRGG